MPLKSYFGIIETVIIILEILHSGARKIGSSFSEIYSHANIMPSGGISSYQF